MLSPKCNGEGDDVEFPRNGLCPAQGPIDAFRIAIKQGLDIPDNPFQVDNRVSRKDLGQTVGDIAGQALSRPFLELNFKMELSSSWVMSPESKLDVIGPF